MNVIITKGVNVYLDDVVGLRLARSAGALERQAGPGFT